MTSDESLYRAPQSALDRPVPNTARSLDDATEGRWDFDLGEVLSEGWRLVDGSKGVVWLGVLLSIAANFAAGLVGALLAQAESIALLASGLTNLVAYAIGWAVQGGMWLYAIRRAAGDERASFDDVLKGLAMIVPIFGVMALYLLIGMVGTLLLVLPGIYAFVALSFAVPLKIERGLGVWDSITTSFRAVRHGWFKVFALMLVTSVAVGFGSILTLGIGAIWLVPFGMLVYAVAYREIFGYAGGD